jgi:molybdenum cofactor guanylyltransferase
MQALTLWKYLVRCGLNRLLTAHRRLQPRQSEPRSSGAPLLAALFAREVGIVADTGMLNNRARNCRLFTQVEMNPRTCDMYHRHMPVPLTDVTAFILAGGKSTRMGTDKAFVELEGRPLLSRALDIARSVTLNVNTVGDPRKFATYATVVEDIFPNCGPLGGIHAALSSSSTELNLILAVDVPFVSTALLEYLLEHARMSPAVVTVAQTGRGYQPLSAIYRRQFADMAEKALREGRYKIDSLFPSTNTQVITEEELKAAGFSQTMFRNLNTRKELSKASEMTNSH